MISRLSTQQTKKIFRRATPQESAMSSGKIVPTALRSSAVRRHSADAFPRRSSAVLRGSFFASACTPARWVAEKLDRQWQREIGSGGVVAAATVLQPRCNRQLIEIIALIAPVAGLQEFPRVMCAPVRVRRRAHMRGVEICNLATCPYYRVYRDSYRLQSGCRTVAAATGAIRGHACAARSAGLSSGSNIIGVGNGSAPACRWSRASIRGHTEGRVAQSFGDFGAARLGRIGGCDAWADRLALDGRNGGFPWVSAPRYGHVGTPMLERHGQGVGIAALSVPRRQLAGLTVAALGGQIGRGGIVPSGGGAAPHSAPRRSLCTLAHAIFFVRIGLRHGIDDCLSQLGEGRQSRSAQTGSGVKKFPLIPRDLAGWGGNAGCGLCRAAESSGVRAHVN